MEQTIKYRGFWINIEQDDDPLNPREDFDNLGSMVCWHGRYRLGDNDKTLGYRKPSTPQDLWRMLAQEHVPFDLENSTNETIRGIIDKHYIVLPLYLYDHSGITISTGPFSCPWDSGQVGWIYISNKKACEEYNWKKLSPKRRKKIIKYLKSEVKTYDDYLTGNVYGYRIEPTDANKSIHCNDSCHGFFGDSLEYLLEEAKSAIDWAILEFKTKIVAEVFARRKQERQLDNFMKTCWAF